MNTIMTIPLSQSTYDFWDLTIILTENDDVSEVGLKVSNDVMEVQVPKDETDKALEIINNTL
tara:strand:- start:63 stop:248 length:186 start_codon:yes stop_codon:yes gene_type:complete